MNLSAEQNYSHSHQETRQNWRVASWCFKKGISIDAIEGHPYYEDILFLTQFQDEFEKEYKSNAVYYNCVKAYWSIVVKDRLPLTAKAFAKFERIARYCLDIRQQNKIQRNKINSIRHKLAPAKLRKHGS
jgi:hypothetical protein